MATNEHDTERTARDTGGTAHNTARAESDTERKSVGAERMHATTRGLRGDELGDRADAVRRRDPRSPDQHREDAPQALPERRREQRGGVPARLVKDALLVAEVLEPFAPVVGAHPARAHAAERCVVDPEMQQRLVDRRAARDGAL